MCFDFERCKREENGFHKLVKFKTSNGPVDAESRFWLYNSIIQRGCWSLVKIYNKKKKSVKDRSQPIACPA